MNHFILSILSFIWFTFRLLDVGSTCLIRPFHQQLEIGLLDVTNFVLGIGVLVLFISVSIKIAHGVVRLLHSRKEQRKRNAELFSFLHDVGVTMQDGGTDLLNGATDAGCGDELPGEKPDP
jgi:hypothetical protein